MDIEVGPIPEAAGSHADVPHASAGEAAAAAHGPRAAARLIAYQPGRYVALPPHTTYALIEQPEIAAVPGAARYAHGMITWQGGRIALLDLNALLYGASVAPGAVPRYALVAAWQGRAGAPLGYGAIGLHELPQTISVGDDMQCGLPVDSERWPQLALACFEYQGQAVPILDTARLFMAYHG